MVRRSSPSRKKKSPGKRGAKKVKGAAKPPVSLVNGIPVDDKALKKAHDKAVKILAKREVLDSMEDERRGRPTDYDRESLKFVRALAGLGATEFEIAQHLGITTVTMWRWKAAHPDFCKALEVGEKSYLTRIKRTLKHRALGYSFESEKLFYDKDTGEVVRATTVEHVPPDVGAIKFVMTNLDPENWKERGRVELTTPPGQPLQLSTAPGVELLENYYARLKSAGIAPSADPSVIEHLGPDGRPREEPAGDPDTEPRRSVLPVGKGPR
jgi:hypothetical protein